MTNNTKIWSTMTKEEKTTRLFAMKAEGYTNKEIGEYYGVSEDAIRMTLKRSETEQKRTLSEIHTSPIKVEFNVEMISSLFEQIEQLKLEVASVKKLQVENAAIERLDDTEYKYFIYKNTELLDKFKDLDTLSDYLYKETGTRFHSVNIGRQLERNKEWRCQGLLIKQCFKNENDNMSRELDNWKIEGKLLQTELENIKSNL